MQPQLERLRKLDREEMRQVWPGEASNFTPWLAQPENLQLLGETIGLELELEATEHGVGPFRADILCKEVGSERWILVENQLEGTDHTHLGQLITYAAGLDAVTIVWIAHRFRDEHRAALDWLNAITGSDIHFFGLEIELWKIGESPAAPKFNIVSQPNDWIKPGGTGPNPIIKPTSTQALQLRFWTGFHDFLLENSKALKPRKPYPQNWMTFSFGRGGLQSHAVMSFWNNATSEWNKGEIRAEVNMQGDVAKAFYPQLEAQKAQIEIELGESLIWNTTGKIYRIQLRRDADLEDETRWPEYFAWLQEHLERLYQVFRPRIQNLTASE